jgi:hypothetical protein
VRSEGGGLLSIDEAEERCRRDEIRYMSNNCRWFGQSSDARLGRDDDVPGGIQRGAGTGG